MQALVLGRRCSAALLDKAGAAAVQGLLSADAKPFVPAQLRMLFDHQPQQFYASPGNKLRCIWGDQGRGAVNRKVRHCVVPDHLAMTKMDGMHHVVAAIMFLP